MAKQDKGKTGSNGRKGSGQEKTRKHNKGITSGNRPPKKGKN